MNKGLNQKLHRKSQRKQYKNLSLEYKNLINETVPDLWERIEVGIEVSDSQEKKIESGNCLRREELPLFFNSADSAAEAPVFSKIESRIMRRTAVAACVCLVAAVPLLFIIVSDLSREGRKSAESGSGADYMADGAADYNMADYDMADNAITDNVITNNDAASNRIAGNQQDFLKSDNTQERNDAPADNSIISEDAYDTDRSVAAGSNAEQMEQEIMDGADSDTFAEVMVTATVLEAELQDNVNVYTIQIDDLGDLSKREADVLDVPDKPDVSEVPNISGNSIFTKQLEIGSQIQAFSQSNTVIELTIGRQYKLQLLLEDKGGNVRYIIEEAKVIE